MFFVAGLALFSERIIQCWRKPKLRMDLQEPSLTVARHGKSNVEQKRWYYLILVCNDRPRARAENVAVFLTAVYKKRPDGCWQRQKFSADSCQVTWRFPSQHPQRETIGCNQETVAFGYVAQGSSRWCLELYWTPNNLTPWITPSEPTRLEFKAVSVGGESKPLTVEVAWDGTWVEGEKEMQQHCVVKKVT